MLPLRSTRALDVMILQKGKTAEAANSPRTGGLKKFFAVKPKGIAVGPDQKEESCVSLELQAGLCWLRLVILQGMLNSEGMPRRCRLSSAGGRWTRWKRAGGRGTPCT